MDYPAMTDEQLMEAIDTGLEWWCFARYAFAANPAKHYLGMQPVKC